MIKSLGVVEVRREGDRVARIARRLGGKPILERVVRRATDCQRLDAVVVIAVGEGPDDAVRRLVPADVPMLSLPQLDPLAMMVAAADKFQARSLVHISADHPFIDPVLVDRLLITADEHSDCDYIGYSRADGRPAILTHVGMFAEWCSAAALTRAHQMAKRVADRAHATAFIYGRPETFNVRLIPLPVELDREDLRLKIVGEEDWEHAQVIYEALGHDEWDWRHVAELLHGQPALRTRMAVLNRAQ